MLKKLSLFIIFIPLFLTGCYGKTELDDLAYVIAMGADVNPSGDDGQIQITYQVAIPLKITGESNETGKETYTTYSTIAPSLSIASSKINTIASKEVDLSHVSLILYSKELAMKGLAGHVNSLISDVSIRPRTIVSICEGSAKEFLETVSPTLETSPARYYELLISSFKYTSRSAGTEILDFYTASQSLYNVPIAITSKIDEDNKAKFSGITAFKGLKYVGEIDEDNLIGHLLLTGDLNEASISMPCPMKEDKFVTLTIKEAKRTKISVSIKDNTPYAKIKVFTNSHLDSNGGSIDFYNRENSNLLNEKTKEYIKNEIENYLQKTIEIDADICGLGRFAKVNYLTWGEFEKTNWKDIYKNLKYEVEVENDLNVSQIITNSIPAFE